MHGKISSLTGDPLKGGRVPSKKKQLRNWIILVLLGILIVVAWRFFSSLGNTSEIVTTRLPCYTHQDVTIFGDHVLYYDNASLHCASTSGNIVWSFRVGSDAQFSVSDDHVIVWQASRISILDRNGKPSYSDSVGAEVQLARIGQRYCMVVSGSDTEPTITIRDLQGSLLDTMEPNVFSGMLILDAGFYGEGGQYMWTLAMDVYGPAVSTTMNLTQVGKMNLGMVSLGENLVYKVHFDNTRLRVFSTQQMYTYDYRGVQDVNGTRLVHGWRLQDASVPDRGDTALLLAKNDQVDGIPAITELRLLTGAKDRYYTLPSACVGTAIDGNYINAFSGQYLYRTHVDSQRFYAYAYQLENNGRVTSFLGLTKGGQAIVGCGSAVYAVSLPK